MNTFIHLSIAVTGAWLIVIAFMTSANSNLPSKLVFKAIPFLAGLALLFDYAKLTGAI